MARGLPVAEHTALQMKKAVVGTGSARKEQVQAMVSRLLALPGVPGKDAADALGLAIAQAHAGHSLAALAQAPVPGDLARYLDDIERDILMRALEQHRCNRTAAGASMGLSLRQMRYRMARLGVQVTDQGVVHDPASATRSSSDDGDEG
mgnify:CR=1 FL=1